MEILEELKASGETIRPEVETIINQICHQWTTECAYILKDISCPKQYTLLKDTKHTIISEVARVGFNEESYGTWCEIIGFNPGYMGWVKVTAESLSDLYWYSGNEMTVHKDTVLMYYYMPEVEAGKPIIYLYPTEETEINVKAASPEKFTVTYPKYDEAGWNVIAKPDGTLKDTKTGRKLYSLYYEAKVNMDINAYKDGFIVKGEEMKSFLEEKLAILGLNEREAQEFIIYWLPKLEGNKYTFIRFAESEYINSEMPLEINPAPDNLIRVLMEFKPIEEPFEVQEQELTTPTREGYTVVEWGATQIY